MTDLFLRRFILLYKRVGENTKQTNVKSQIFAHYYVCKCRHFSLPSRRLKNWVFIMHNIYVVFSEGPSKTRVSEFYNKPLHSSRSHFETGLSNPNSGIKPTCEL